MATFTPREKEVLAMAFYCFKTGIPEVDYERLTTMAGFGTRKTAVNTWATIKNKLKMSVEANVVNAAACNDDETKGGGEGVAPSTPTRKGKAAATKSGSVKKRKPTAVDDDGNDIAGEEGSPSSHKKPCSRGRGGRKTKTVKEEDVQPEDLLGESVKAEAVED